MRNRLMVMALLFAPAAVAQPAPAPMEAGQSHAVVTLPDGTRMTHSRSGVTVVLPPLPSGTVAPRVGPGPTNVTIDNRVAPR